jgi:hypothetical protein
MDDEIKMNETDGHGRYKKCKILNIKPEEKRPL